MRSVSGQLLWATPQSRPDASFDACAVSNYGKEPIVRSILMDNRSVKRLQGNHVQLVFPELGDIRKLKVITSAEASHANLPYGASQGAILVLGRK